MGKLLIFGFVLAFLPLQAQIVNIPDPNFKHALVNTECVDINGDGIGDVDADTNDDGEIQVDEAEAVYALAVSYRDISSLVGIEYFINLEVLLCSSNLIAELDLTQNLKIRSLVCWSNSLTSLNLFENIDLEMLNCFNNPIISLDLSNNPDLTFLNCSSNLLTELDLTQNPNLNYINCLDNSLTFLNIQNGNNQIINPLIAIDNPDLFCIQVDDVEFANSANWFIDEQSFYSEDCSLGTDTFSVNKPVIFPNPAKDILRIDFNDPFLDSKIFNLQGGLLIQTKNTSIDVSALSSGIYFISFSVNDQILTKKFVKS